MIIDTTCSVVEQKMKKASELPIIEINKSKDGFWNFAISSSEWCAADLSDLSKTNWSRVSATGNNTVTGDNTLTWEYTVPSDGVSNWTISTDNFYNISI